MAALLIWTTERAARNNENRRVVSGVAGLGLVPLLAAIGLGIYQFQTLPFTTIDGSYASTFEFFMGSTLAHVILLTFIALGLWNRARLGRYNDGRWYRLRVIRYFAGVDRRFGLRPGPCHVTVCVNGSVVRDRPDPTTHRGRHRRTGAAPPAHRTGPAVTFRPRSETDKLRALLVGSVTALALIVLLLVGLGPHAPVGSPSGPVAGRRRPGPRLHPPLPDRWSARSSRCAGSGSPPSGGSQLLRLVVHALPQGDPTLARAAAAEQAKASSLQFVGVDVADKPTDALPFVEESGIAYPVGTDAALRVSANLYGLERRAQYLLHRQLGPGGGPRLIGAVTPTQLDGWIHRLTGSTR